MFFSFAEQVKLDRRARLFAESKFVPVSRHSPLMVPIHIPRHIRVYLNYISGAVKKRMLYKGNPRQQQVFIAFPKHAIHLPRRAKVIVVQLEQTHFDETEYLRPSTTGRALHDKAYDELIGGIRLQGGSDAFARADRIVDYSRANILNVIGSPVRELYDGKALYVAPLLGSAANSRKLRDNPRICSMFGSPHLGRRAHLIKTMKQHGLTVENIQDFEDYERAFSNAGILINASQKTYLQTPEELRILPALLSGVIVVSESNKYIEGLDYGSFIVQSQIDKMPETVSRIRETYCNVWQAIFQQPNETNLTFSGLVRSLTLSNELAFQTLASLSGYPARNYFM